MFMVWGGESRHDRLGEELPAEWHNIGSSGPIHLKDSVLGIMTHHIHLLPGRRDLVSEGADTLLEAALRAGLALNYGCSNGNCGLCKARVISGAAKKVRHHDFVLSQTEKATGHILLCSYAAETDLVIEAIEAGGTRDIPVQHIAARIRAIEHLRDATLLLHVQTPRTQRLRFLAGQYVTMDLGGAVTADLSIASCPCDDRNLQFHVPRLDDSPFSQRAFEVLRIGDTVSIEGPKGDFVLREEASRPLVFLACDCGFAPIKSLIEHAMALDVAGSIHLCWLSSTKDGHYMDNLCRSWSDALDNFYYLPLVLGESWSFEATPAKSEPLEAAIDELVKWIDGEGARLARYTTYIAGPKPCMVRAEQLLLVRGALRDQLFASCSS
jgi:CDP-4-dehydro-6-deoxyglucose reductase